MKQNAAKQIRESKAGQIESQSKEMRKMSESGETTDALLGKALMNRLIEEERKLQARHDKIISTIDDLKQEIWILKGKRDMCQRSKQHLMSIAQDIDEGKDPLADVEPSSVPELLTSNLSDEGKKVMEYKGTGKCIYKAEGDPDLCGKKDLKGFDYCPVHKLVAHDGMSEAAANAVLKKEKKNIRKKK